MDHEKSLKSGKIHERSPPMLSNMKSPVMSGMDHEKSLKTCKNHEKSLFIYRYSKVAQSSRPQGCRNPGLLFVSY